MPRNPFKPLPGSKKLNSPASICPLTKAELGVEVKWHDPRVGLAPANPLSGVKINVAGPTNTAPATTGGAGTWRYQPLSAGNYTVTLTFPSDLDERYDITGVNPAGETLAAGDNKTVAFNVPANWVEFIVQDTANRALPNLRWTLERHPAGGGNFDRYDKGATPNDGKVFRIEVLNGRHRFSIRELSNPTWSATEAILDEKITLKVTAIGYEAGETGTFEIVDPLNPGPVLDTVSSRVKAVGAGFEMEASWKPAEGRFANLKHGRIQFRATSEQVSVYSAPLPLLKKEKLKFADESGTAVNRQVTAYFTGGTNVTVTTAKGEAELQIPWGESLLALGFPGLASARVKMEGAAVDGAVVA